MKIFFWAWVCLVLPIELYCQTEQLKSEQEQLLETVSEEVSELDNEGDLIELDHFRRHPLDLNTADADNLKVFNFLTDAQINGFLKYRASMGHLIHLFELQAVPAWDIATIKKILPFVTLVDQESVGTNWRKGEHQLLWRMGTKFLGDDNADQYSGNKLSLLFRYSYRYKNECRIGITGDKDAGETFFKRNNRFGFDFYSMHIFLQPSKRSYALVLGDYTVQWGQGLIQWQGLAFGKSAESMMINRQGPMLKPYTSSGEFNFHRGLAVQWTRKHFQYMGFVSFRKLSANRIEDSLSGTTHFSSIQTSGYHRTEAELIDKNLLRMFSVGLAAKYKFDGGAIGAQLVSYVLSDSLIKPSLPYNYYSFKGRRLQNASIDARYSYRNFYFFSELAVDRQFSKAIVGGVIVSVGGGLDFSVLYRQYDRSFHSFFSNSFAEFSGTTNEEGLYMGLQYKFNSAWRLSLYSDLFKYSWVRFRLDRPGSGWKTLFQVNYTPSKTTELYWRYRSQQTINDLGRGAGNSGFRIHFQNKPNNLLEWRIRAEINWLSEQKRTIQRGALFFSDLFYTHSRTRFGMGLRILFFDTNGFDSRVYAFEPDVLYSYNTPTFYGRGWRWVVNYKIKTSKFFNIKIYDNMTFWIKFAQTVDLASRKTIPIGQIHLKNNLLDARIQIISTF